MGLKLQSLAGAALVAIAFLPAAGAQDMSRNIPTASDAAWAQKVAQGGAAEVRLGEMARLRSTNDSLRSFLAMSMF